MDIDLMVEWWTNKLHDDMCCDKPIYIEDDDFDGEGYLDAQITDHNHE